MEVFGKMQKIRKQKGITEPMTSFEKFLFGKALNIEMKRSEVKKLKDRLKKLEET